MEEPQQNSSKDVIHGITSMVSPRYINLSFAKLFWIFVVGSILGLLIEDVFHVLVYHEWESRAGLVWGPFSPLYGVGAVVLTVFLNRFYYTHNLIIFLIAMVLGSAMEYLASLIMEVFWHAIAWDYSGTFGSIDGRTNFLFGVMWGMLGLVWVRMIMPRIKFIFQHVNFKSMAMRIFTWFMIAFMTVNIVVTVLALHREGQRTENIPPATPVDVWLDETFPDDWMQKRFENMAVSKDVGAENS